MKKLILVTLLAGNLSACAIGTPYTDQGYIALSADRQGMEAFGDALNGLVTNGKANPDSETDAWKTRRVQDAEQTRRALKPSFLQGLFARSDTPSSQPVRK